MEKRRGDGGETQGTSDAALTRKFVMDKEVRWRVSEGRNQGFADGLNALFEKKRESYVK